MILSLGTGGNRNRDWKLGDWPAAVAGSWAAGPASRRLGGQNGLNKIVKDEKIEKKLGKQIAWKFFTFQHII